MGGRTLVLVAMLASWPHMLAAGDAPSITFEYNELLDQACADVGKESLTSGAVEELGKLLPELERQWRDEGPAWLTTASEVVGRPFAFREAKAALITCGMRSLSDPLIINMRPYLSATTGAKPAALTVFVDTLFHELLHRYVWDLLRPDVNVIPLYEKYVKEPTVVLNHLHLFAIQDAAYRRRGRGADLERVKAFEAGLRRAKLFARAREIVQAEGVERFLAELRSPQ